MPKFIKCIQYFIFCLLLFTMACEKDDICLAETPATPQVIMRFFDAQNTSEAKTPSEAYVRAIYDTETLLVQMTDSIALPLNTGKTFTTFEFIMNFNSEIENIDSLQFQYSRYDQYINRACGFKAAYVFDNQPILTLNPGNNWILNYTVLKDTIANETETHVAIYH